jgi:sugar lactone lactonase YvrE
VTKKSFVPTQTPDVIQPTTLAAQANGDILILDSSRDQILRLTPGGTLSVFAGSGRLGFSGDGGPATKAELDFQYFSQAGMAVAPNGTVYFVDDGNCRIRAIGTDGIIRTIAKIALVPIRPSGTYCKLNGLAVSSTGEIYVSTPNDVDRVTSQGTLAWVAGSSGDITNEPKVLTASTVVMSPESITFDSRGDLDIWSDEPRVIYQLSPSGIVADLGVEYATQLTTSPDGMVLAGTHGGEIDAVGTGGGVQPYRQVFPRKVTGLNWGSDQGFQENGIAVAPSGVIYVDNARGNGYGLASVLVSIAASGKARVVTIRTPLDQTLPSLGASGFPVSLYPASRKSNTSAFPSCPSAVGLEPFTHAAVADALMIASKYQSSQFASDLADSDRSWWPQAFAEYKNADLGVHSVRRWESAEQTPIGEAIGRACGQRVVRDSIEVSIGRSGFSDAIGSLYLLDRNGHPMVYDANIQENN